MTTSSALALLTLLGPAVPPSLELRGCAGEGIDRPALERMLEGWVQDSSLVIVDAADCRFDRVEVTVRSSEGPPRAQILDLGDHARPLRHRAVGLLVAQLAQRPPPRPVFSAQPEAANAARPLALGEPTAGPEAFSLFVHANYGVGFDLDDSIDAYGFGSGLHAGYTFPVPIYAGFYFDYYNGDGEEVLGRGLEGGALLLGLELGYDLLPQGPTGISFRPTLGIGYGRFLRDVDLIRQYPSSFVLTPGLRLVVPVVHGVLLSMGGRVHIPTRDLSDSEKAVSLEAGVGFRL